ncbi:MAG: hypothetical protein UT03_C0027G0009 [Candidatus Moranbacteria bacterium GW2011_GWD2_38_7]|nr:MAG: hypothetical protein UT03_C0027G0009 [Candidatus Moranbacteria bacterium GW2011_GWD2_38_7]
MEKEVDEKMICARCGYIGQKERFSKGSYLLEIFLWCMLFVPGALYTTWRAFNEYHACPICRNEAMTPLDSQFGKEIFRERTRLNEQIKPLDLFDVVSKILRW